MTKLYQCQCCDKTFPYPRSLKVHFRKHSGEKPYSCTVCGNKFAQNSHLTRHVRLVHQGERPFACNECGKEFGERSSLRNHMRIHTKERVACELCQKTFSHPSTLQSHVRLHSERTPFQCLDCPLKFTQKVNMNRHRNKFHMDGGRAPAAAAEAASDDEEEMSSEEDEV